jgi:hypothetical protein
MKEAVRRGPEEAGSGECGAQGQGVQRLCFRTLVAGEWTGTWLLLLLKFRLRSTPAIRDLCYHI